ncbi:uncharacterized protein F4807DRAFT_346276 [Annulohypoxylon truncatum]|uniref:uncharacterized protein n=1 Tax=Annulohypoxylon truncatum TaxID=327061 RepID=UPI0020080FC6|nr:uncharacterized protein F4807DRAFT_346276 [Annulohypoxylon truncatum]KAI1212694.1 hypothetical protein F4807DRAFT_346276 [Annulohypoxylon truncatum]
MEALQGLRPCQKRPRDDYDSDDKDLPVAKRQGLLPLHPLAHHRDPTTYLHNETKQNAGPQEVFNHDIQQSQQDLAQLSTDSCARFPQFRMLPPELRRQIWRETWEHRNVKLARRISLVADARQEGQRDTDLIIFALHHSHVTRKHWDIREHESNDCLYSQGPYAQVAPKIVTHTRSTTRPPVSLWVNRESRDETLMRFKLSLTLPVLCPYNQIRDKPSELSNIRTFVYFNFDLDRLVFPLHSPLSTAFSQLDLSRLRRISIPEWGPALPFFTKRIGPNDHMPRHLLPKIDDEDQVVRYDEFKYVWRLLRKWFPSLREIHLDKFTECERYQTTSRRQEGTYSDLYLTRGTPNCDFCSNSQSAITRFFPRLGRKDQYGPQHDIDCILEGHGIIQPVFKKRTLTIGRVKGERGKLYEKVTVTFWAIHDDDNHSNVVDLRERGRDWASVRRQVVARTLERALGPPVKGEYMTYHINPEAIERGCWDEDD